MAAKEPEKKEDADAGLSAEARAMHQAAPWISAVWKLVGGAVTGVLAGYFLDKWLGTTPWLLLGLTTLGIGVGFYGFIHTAMTLGKKK